MEWKKTHDNDYYINCFKEQVTDKITINEVFEEISTMIGFDNNVDICFVCYEKPSDFCHRQLVAKWFRENGFKCEEWSDNK